MVEYSGSGSKYNVTQACLDIFPEDLGGWTNWCDSWNNTFDCVRMIDGSQAVGQLNGTKFCRFTCYGAGRVEVPCEDDGSAQVVGEFYALDEDAYELSNLMWSLNSTTKQMYDDTLGKLLACSGQTECNALRMG